MPLFAKSLFVAYFIECFYCLQNAAKICEELQRKCIFSDKVRKGEISQNEAQRPYGILIHNLSRRLKTGNTTKSGFGPQGIYFVIVEVMFFTSLCSLYTLSYCSVRTNTNSCCSSITRNRKRKTIASYIKRLVSAGFAPDRSTIRSLAY